MSKLRKGMTVRFRRTVGYPGGRRIPRGHVAKVQSAYIMYTNRKQTYIRFRGGRYIIRASDVEVGK
jgi:hypothetical protein